MLTAPTSVQPRAGVTAAHGGRKQVDARSYRCDEAQEIFIYVCFLYTKNGTKMGERPTVGSRTADQPLDGSGSWSDIGGDVVRILRRLIDVRGNIRFLRVLFELAAPDRPIAKLLMDISSDGKTLGRGGELDRLLAQDSMTALVSGEDGLVRRLIKDGGTLDQIEQLNSAMLSMQPILEALGPGVRAAAGSPLGDLVSMFPGKRRQPDGGSGPQSRNWRADR